MSARRRAPHVGPADARRAMRRTQHTFGARSCKVGDRLLASDARNKGGSYNMLTDGRKKVLERYVSSIFFRPSVSEL